MLKGHLPVREGSARVVEGVVEDQRVVGVGLREREGRVGVQHLIQGLRFGV